VTTPEAPGGAAFVIGAKVECRDGQCGDLKRVVVDPVARSITHLVVGPSHPRGLDHLVPVELAALRGGTIRLECTRDELSTLEEAEETHFLNGAAGRWGYEQDEMLSLPYFGLATGGMGGMGMDRMGAPYPPDAITVDRVPLGEIEVRRGDRVHATDGAVGRVQGLVIDPSDHHVTHVLLEDGHLWGKRDVAIPIGAVTDVEDGIAVRLTKDQVRDLPAVEIDRQ